ncbi:MAG: hypothetical protein UU82_C0038G0009 [Candidatus Nomurabacteria bacterium GW2011_GWC2_41_8]|uniref:Glycoside hydrolase family 42 N-terminal domain-containing protein n=3 Tax=Patescibacteria group TaxID=1783273 RepID=A0A1F6YAZ5_9BACT|nr:MAG: hypothetical protein US86_C0015G0001 [Candidatus Daviesbacteria bacterium GW2011_GWA2_38_24]KKS23195.1 MAG: hypothetical protein UU82_C0038G0009 [Candidatus Nomurabacteria bacterium GW2011_GWC2_41_8]OGI66936.1 MAG: hypothetical protein A2823_03030 [Candidatus Nomurabacteria bacterium RIFCSPHIGHO2_01_FULL_41_91]OGJ03519.1 MAG: hypothetical protein A3F97_01765 [Candidatus Nomurabacteria bacterium RIFCSPLOWO2_12_FULL_41_10]
MKSKKFFVVLIVLVIVGGLSFAFKICPPSGPWPTPPWCSGSGFSLPFGIGSPTQKPPAGITDFEISKPKYIGARGMFSFPPSCTLIPDKIAQSVCEDFKAGAIIFWQEEACAAMPISTAVDTCKNERAKLQEIGDEKITTLRKENPEWWKRPDLNVYVYGDTRLRTEELRPDVSVWGGGSYDGWRNDEIFMTHAAGIFKIVSHSFGYLGGNDLDYMRGSLIKDEGIAITGPADLQKPEVLKIKNDFEYLKSKSPIYQKLAPAIAKDFDNHDIVVDYTFPDGSKAISNILANAIIPEFKNYLIQYYKWQVDANTDGMFVDDLAGLSPANSWNENIMKQFGAWLAAKPDKSELAQYGVKNWTSFNYRDFLHGKGYTKTTIDNTVGKTIGASNAWRNIPLMVEFRTFLTEENQKALIDIITQVKAYAKEKGLKKFVVTGNSGELAPSGAFIVPYFDYFTFEHAYLKGNNPLIFQSVIPLSHLALAKEKPVANQILVDNWNVLAHDTAAPLKYDLMRLGIMESYAAGSTTSYVRYSLNDPRQKSNKMNDIYFALEDRTDLREVQKAYGFIRHSFDTFRDFTNSTAKVAIIYDNNEVVREWKDALTADHQYSVENIGKDLYAADVAYDVINWQELAMNNKQYQYVILPIMHKTSPDSTAALQKAKDVGVKIINESAVSSVFGNIPVLKLPPKMKTLIKTDAKGNMVAHLFNYNYDAFGFKTQKNIPINISFFGTAKKITFASLENPDPVELDLSKPIILSLLTYGMLVIEK